MTLCRHAHKLHSSGDRLTFPVKKGVSSLVIHRSKHGLTTVGLLGIALWLSFAHPTLGDESSLPPVVTPANAQKLETEAASREENAMLPPVVIASEAGIPRLEQGITLSIEDLPPVEQAFTTSEFSAISEVPATEALIRPTQSLEDMPSEPTLLQPELPSYLRGERLPLDEQVFQPDMSVLQDNRIGPPQWAIGFPGAATAGGYRIVNGSSNRTLENPNYDGVLNLFPNGDNRRLIEQVRQVVQETEVGIDVSQEDWVTIEDGRRITWGGRLDFDWVNWAQKSEFLDQSNYVEARRVRLFAAGEGYGVYDYVVELNFGPEFDGDTGEAEDFGVEFKDAFIGLRDLPLLGYLVLGHYRVQMGLENVTSSRFIPFMEKSLTRRLLPGRELGIGTFNQTASERATWFVGAYFADFNDGVAAIVDDSQGSRVVGRATWTPYFDELSHRCFVHTGMSYMYTRPRKRQDLIIFDPVYRPVRFDARPEIHLGTPLIDTGIQNVQQYQTANYELAWVNGPMTIQSEFTWSKLDTYGDGQRDLFGGYVHGSFFLTGEQRTYNRQFGRFGRVVPYENFWVVPTDGGPRAGWGAWEVAARWSHLSFSSVNEQYLNDFTLGVNWYWNSHSRLMFNWIHPFAHNSNIANPTDRVDSQGDIIALRMQLDF